MYDNTERNAPPVGMEQFRQPIQYRRLRKRKKSLTVWRWIQSVLIGITLALLVRFFVFDFTTLKGPSMYPTLIEGEKLFLDKLTFRFTQPARGDVVMCEFVGDSKNTYIKRVVGLGGESLEIKGGRIYINGEPLPDEYQKPITDDKYTNWPPKPYKIPEGSLFVMGDNRDDSYDSRENGYIPLSSIHGKVRAVIWPLGNFKTFD